MKVKVRNIPYKEYFTLLDRSEIDSYLKYGKFESKDLFNFGDFTSLEFGFVKDVQELFTDAFLTWKMLIDEIVKYKKIRISEISKLGVFDLHCSFLYIKEQIELINKIESENLGHTPTFEENEAGIEVFQKYKSFPQFLSLCNGDLTKLESIRKIEYSVCFAKLMYDADYSQYESNLFRIRNKT